MQSTIPFLFTFFLFSIHNSLRSTAVALLRNFIPTSASFIPLASHAHAYVNVRAEYSPRGYAHRRCSPHPWLLFVFFFLPAAMFSIPSPYLPRSPFISSVSSASPLFRPYTRWTRVGVRFRTIPSLHFLRLSLFPLVFFLSFLLYEDVFPAFERTGRFNV